MTPRGGSDIRIDALLPAEMAAKAELTGVNKAGTDNLSLLLLALLAGAFIALGCLFYTTTIAGASATLPYGVVRLLGGVVFALGLVLAICAGAELFTSDNLIVMAWASGKVSTASMLRTWVIVYVGNFVGAGATAVFVYVSGQYPSATAWSVRRRSRSPPASWATPSCRTCVSASCATCWSAWRCGSRTARAPAATR